ncbi:MAG: hypothetical protein Unbinned1007contig1000_2 [Prokaryotic dsDNA virus sp.]|nr:MAG: hypothetical protein Unbinned1007contig1000_2 [Prokaryotic dsDNA virus sp.]
MAKVQPAFTAKFRVVDNHSDASNAPEKNMILDFTVEEAMKAASFLVQKCEEAETKNTKIRIYTDKKEYHEESGFSLWGGMWGNSGRLQPLPPQDASQSNSRAEETISVDDLPF